MDLNILTLIVAVAALLVGIIAGKFIFAKDTRKRIEEAELQAQTITKEAELRAQTIRKEKELEAKEKFVQLAAGLFHYFFDTCRVNTSIGNQAL